MTEDTEKATDRLVSRREALAGGTLAAGLLALAGESEPAAASHTEPTDNLIELGDSFVLFDAGDDAVIKHKPSGAEFVYNQAQSRWELDAPLDLGDQDLSGVGTLTADSIDYNGLTPDYRLAGPATQIDGFTSTQTTTGTSYSTIFNLAGTVDTNDIPTGATLYGRHFMGMTISNASETVFAQPRFLTNNGTGADITELEISHTGDTAFNLVDSGWVEITTTLTDVISFLSIEGKVTGGTGEYFQSMHGVLLAGVQ